MDLSPVVRLELTVERWRVSIAVMTDAALETDDDADETANDCVAGGTVIVPPTGSTCGDLDRAGAWDHDNRPPLGFQS